MGCRSRCRWGLAGRGRGGADPTALANFWALVSGGGFRGVMFVFGPAELPGRLAYYFGYLS